ncbi:hypothetical protein K1T71_003707 [Dendrolimus kikuchii]|uniref:Uncharacterized protein n=1 Tax=Dendrolimus kikuchii TaxID=765133 RepID=A0ACC1D8Q6_9NEOP|nr:hypothetical protein K1T71_003707 [Dendrolimus kikuchii]
MHRVGSYRSWPGPKCERTTNQYLCGYAHHNTWDHTARNTIMWDRQSGCSRWLIRATELQRSS